MLRFLIALVIAAAVVAGDAKVLLAAEATAWPSLGTDFSRGSGFYFSIWKILAVWLVFLCWVRSTDWVSQDSQTLKLRWALWNAIVFFVFFFGLLMVWILPLFAAGIILLLVAYIAPLATYIVYRNRQVTSPYDKVLSNKHTRRWMAQKAALIGIKMEGADIDPRDLGPDIKLTAAGGDERQNNVNLLTARQSAGFLPARELLDDARSQRATDVMLDYTAEVVGVRYQIDGVWHDRAPLDRASGDLVLAVYKGLAGLKIEDRRSRQSGSFGGEAAKEKFTCKITSQGTKTGGERVLLQFEQVKVPFKTLEELGMRPKTQEQIEALFQQSGLVVFSSLPGGGLTTTIDLVLMNTDRFMRNFVSVADERKPDREIENIHVTTFSASSGESAATVLPKLIRTYPDVIVVREVADLDTLTLLCEQVSENRLIITSIRAKEAPEALLRLMMLKIPPADFAAAASGVVNVRLIRKLCEKCKEGYPPPAEVLKQLGLPPGRIEALYRPPTAPIDPKHPEAVCDACGGVGYVGRTGLFEVLVVDDAIREVLATAPKLENVPRRRTQGKAAIASGRGHPARGPRCDVNSRIVARAQAIIPLGRFQPCIWPPSCSPSFLAVLPC